MKQIILKGLGVSPGKVVGKINIVDDKNPQQEFQKGEILVTRITNPRMVQMMTRSTGIICDIGGLTSHPSIVSREMGLPCIVSATSPDGKKATEVLQKGMLVEMDGKSGEVRIIKETFENWIDEFLDACDVGFAGMDLNTIEPVCFLDAMPLYAKEGLQRLGKIISKTKGMSAKDIARQLHSPTVIRCEFIFFMTKAFLAKLPKKEKLRIAEFYNSLLKAWCLEDIYTKDGKNIIHTKQQIKAMLKDLRTANPKIARELGKLTNACYQLSYGLYSDNNPQIVYENFGPYDVSNQFGKGHIMIIKQFQNLRPIRLWGKKITDLPYNKIRIYCVYKDVEFSQDACSHCNYKGDIINGLKHFAVDINGKQIREFSQVSKAIDLIGEKAVDMWKSLTKKDFEQVKITYLEQRCYNYFHLCNLLNIDWRPTPEMIAAVKDKSLSREFWPKFKSIEEEAKFWRAALDPRLEWKDVEKYWK